MKLSWPKEFIDKNINNLISRNEQITAVTREALSELSSDDLTLVCIAIHTLTISSDKYHQIIGMLANDAMGQHLERHVRSQQEQQST